MNIGKRLRKLRHDKGLSQADIEKRTGIIRSYVSRVELGLIVPQLPMLQKWARALRVPLYRILLPDETNSHHGPRARLRGEDNRTHKLLSRIPEGDLLMLLIIAEKMAKPGGLKSANKSKRRGGVLLARRSGTTDIGKRLRELRLAKGLSQSRLARAAGFQQAYVCLVERSYKIPKLLSLERWTMALGISLAEFFQVNVNSGRVVKRVRLTYADKRLFNALRQMCETDRRLWYSVADKMARR